MKSEKFLLIQQILFANNKSEHSQVISQKNAMKFATLTLPEKE